MFKKTLNEAIEEFRLKSASFVLSSNRCELKELYAHLTAAACLNDPEAATQMRQELAAALLTPSLSARLDTFDDL